MLETLPPPENEDVNDRLKGLVHEVVHQIGDEVDFGDVLIYGERHGIPFEQTNQAIWSNILEDKIRLTDTGIVSIQEPDSQL